MKRDPFDLVCHCSYETPSHMCICVKRQHRDYIGPAKPCPDCAVGKHKLIRKGHDHDGCRESGAASRR